MSQSNDTKIMKFNKLLLIDITCFYIFRKILNNFKFNKNKKQIKLFEFREEMLSCLNN